MTQPGTSRYTIVRDDAWIQLNWDLSTELSEAYWPLRVFGLEGRAVFVLHETNLVWGGFLLDLTCALAEWLANPTKPMTFHPAEQSNDIDISPNGVLVRFTSGRVQGTLRATLAITMVSDFVSRVAADLAANVPKIQVVPGFEWVGRYARADRTPLNASDGPLSPP